MCCVSTLLTCDNFGDGVSVTNQVVIHFICVFDIINIIMSANSTGRKSNHTLPGGACLCL